MNRCPTRCPTLPRPHPHLQNLTLPPVHPDAPVSPPSFSPVRLASPLASSPSLPFCLPPSFLAPSVRQHLHHHPQVQQPRTRLSAHPARQPPVRQPFDLSSLPFPQWRQQAKAPI